MTADEYIAAGNSFLSDDDKSQMAFHCFTEALGLISDSERNSQNPRYLACLIGRAKALAGLLNYNAALRETNHALTHFSNDPVLLSIQGWALLKLNKIDEALNSFKATTAAFSTNKRTLSNKEQAFFVYGAADAFMVSGDYSAANKLYTDLLKSDKDNCRCLLGSARLQVYLGDYVTMEKYLRTIISYQKNNFTAYCYLGYALLFQHNYNDAEKYFNYVMGVITKGHPDLNFVLSLARMGLSIIQDKRKNYDAAKFERTASLNYTKNNLAGRHEVLMLYGTYLMNYDSKDGNLAKSSTGINVFNEILKQRPDSIHAAFQKGRLQIKMGDITSAKITLQSILHTNKECVEAKKLLETLNIEAWTPLNSPSPQSQSPPNLRKASDDKGEHAHITLEIKVIAPEGTTAPYESTPVVPFNSLVNSPTLQIPPSKLNYSNPPQNYKLRISDQAEANSIKNPNIKSVFGETVETKSSCLVM